MARTTSVGKILLLGMLAHASLALAQQAQQPPSSAPPKLERIEEGSDVPITVTPQQPAQRKGAKINEKREGGQVTEVQVTSGKSTYTMKGTGPGSVVQTGDNTGSTLRPPQWKVMEFDLFNGKKKQSGEVTDGQTADAPPPPPPPAAIKK
jgi:hypothetical protein